MKKETLQRLAALGLTGVAVAGLAGCNFKKDEKPEEEEPTLSSQFKKREEILDELNELDKWIKDNAEKMQEENAAHSKTEEELVKKNTELEDSLNAKDRELKDANEEIEDLKAKLEKRENIDKISALIQKLESAVAYGENIDVMSCLSDVDELEYLIDETFENGGISAKEKDNLSVKVKSIEEGIYLTVAYDAIDTLAGMSFTQRGSVKKGDKQVESNSASMSVRYNMAFGAELNNNLDQEIWTNDNGLYRSSTVGKTYEEKETDPSFGKIFADDLKETFEEIITNSTDLSYSNLTGFTAVSSNEYDGDAYETTLNYKVDKNGALESYTINAENQEKSSESYSVDYNFSLISEQTFSEQFEKLRALLNEQQKLVNGEIEKE